MFALGALIRSVVGTDVAEPSPTTTAIGDVVVLGDREYIFGVSAVLLARAPDG
jgi:hypothetical protein